MIVDRLKKVRIHRLLLMLASVAVVVTGGAAVAASPAKPQKPTTPPRDPGEESLSERRAVRGAPVDDVSVPAPSLPGSWGGSGDVPPELRSPTPPPAAGAAVPPDSDWLRALKLPDFPV